MVNWSDPQEVAKDSDVFLKLIFTLFGLYVWELFMTSDFEWSLITRRRKFRWPLIFFFLCRYCILLALVGLIISLNVTTRINCGSLFTFNSWTGNMSILCASTTLMLRTIALWDRKRSVMVVLGVLCLAHWTLLYRTMFVVTATWEDDVKTCAVISTNASLLNTTFFFTMAFDFIILNFTAVALLRKHSARTDLWKLLFHDGLVYFLISFSTNCIPAVLNVLNLNTPMNVIATIPAATITSIAACRAVIRLLEFGSQDVHVRSMSAVASNNLTRRSVAPFSLSRPSRHIVRRPEVHVTTEHITMPEISPSETDSPYSGKTLGRRISSMDLSSPKGEEIPSEKDGRLSYGFANAV